MLFVQRALNPTVTFVCWILNRGWRGQLEAEQAQDAKALGLGFKV